MVQSKIQFPAQEYGNFIPDLGKFLLAVPDDDNVIHVPDVPMDVQGMLHILVQYIEVDVCEHLACQIPDGNTGVLQPALWRYFVRAHALRQPKLRLVAVQDGPKQPHHAWVCDLLPNDFQKNLMVYPVEILGNVQFQGIGRAATVRLPHPVLEFIQCRVCAFALTAGIAI